MKNIIDEVFHVSTPRPASLGLALPLLAAMFLGACAPPPAPPVAPPEPAAAPAPEPVAAPVAAPDPTPDPPKPEPLKLPAPVVFATGSDHLSSESEPVLKQVAAYLAQRSDVTLLRIEGHTDNQGMKRQNQRLSEARALSVASWLVRNGVDCKRLVPVGFGDSRPIVENADEDSRSKNRRTVFIDAAIDGKDVGGSRDNGGSVAGDPCNAK